MVERLKSLMVQVKDVSGIDFNFLPDNEIAVAFATLEKQKKVVKLIDKKAFNIKSLEDLPSHLSPNSPIAITLNGKILLHKKVITDDETASDSELLKMAFPTIIAEDFYIQKLNCTNGFIISFARKDVIDKIIKELKNMGFAVISLYFGPFAVDHCIPLIEGVNGQLIFNYHHLSLTDKSIEDYKLLPAESFSKTFLLGDERIEDKYLISYSSALNQFIHLPSDIHLQIDELEQLKEEWKQKNIFKKAGWGLLIFSFLILLANFPIFTQLNEKNALLQSEVDRNETNLIRMESLQKEVKERNYFLKNAGWFNDTKAAFYSDRIASTVPEAINLTELSVNPLDEKSSRMEKKSVFLNGKISIRGYCSDPTILNSWLVKLKEFKWVKDINDQNYSYDYLKRQGSFDFKIKIDD